MRSQEYAPPPIPDGPVPPPLPLAVPPLPLPVGPVAPAVIIQDPEIVRDNPVEAKHRRLVRSHRNGPVDRDLKPNPKIRDELNVGVDKYFMIRESFREGREIGVSGYSL